MDGDRVAALLVELAANGVVNFKDANILDRKWDLRLKWLAQSYMAAKSADVVKLAIMRYTGALGYGSAEMFNESWENMGKLIDSYSSATMPWQENKK